MQYWEGTLKRTTATSARITTQSNAWVVPYGLTDRVSLFGSVPFVWTKRQPGRAAGTAGLAGHHARRQIRFLERSSPRFGALRAIAAASGLAPTQQLHARLRAALDRHAEPAPSRARLTLNYQTDTRLYVNGSTSYTRRGDVTLDRPYYFTDDQLFLTRQVDMPNVVDYTVSVGYLKHDLNTYVAFSQQTTQGGGDIRRQDMPFVSNRMNFSRVGGMAMYPVPKLNAVAFQFAVGHMRRRPQRRPVDDVHRRASCYSHAARSGD